MNTPNCPNVNGIRYYIDSMGNAALNVKDMATSCRPEIRRIAYLDKKATNTKYSTVSFLDRDRLSEDAMRVRVFGNNDGWLSYNEYASSVNGTYCLLDNAARNIYLALARTAEHQANACGPNPSPVCPIVDDALCNLTEPLLGNPCGCE